MACVRVRTCAGEPIAAGVRPFGRYGESASLPPAVKAPQR